MKEQKPNGKTYLPLPDIYTPIDKTSACVLHMPSEVTASAENAVMDAYARSSPDSIRNLILNFSQVEYLNSAGASLLVKLYVQAKQRRQLLKAVGLSEHYQQVFVLIGLNQAMHIDRSRSDTAGKAGKPRDAAHWAKPMSRLKASGMPPQAINLNVEGRRVVGPRFKVSAQCGRKLTASASVQP